MEWFVRQGKSSAPDGPLQLALEYEAFQNGRQHRHGPKSVIRDQVESNYGNELDAHSSGLADEIVGQIAKLILNSSVTPAANMIRWHVLFVGPLYVLSRNVQTGRPNQRGHGGEM